MDEDDENAESTNWRPWACWALVLPFAIWAFVRTIGLESGFPLVQVIAYTPYALVLCLLVLLAVVLLRQWLPFLLGLLAVIALGTALIPRELGSPDEVAGGETVRILSANLLRSKADFDELIELAEVRGTDLLLLQGLTPEGFEEIEDRRVSKTFGHRIYATKEGAGGGAIYPRFRLSRVSAPHTGFRQPRALVRPPGAIPFEVMSVHPMAPAGPKTTATWERDFAKLPSADGPGPPRVLAGDFNATLDHKNLRDLLDTGYRDAGDSMGRGLISTWPSTIKWPLPVTIDHVLAEDPIAIVSYDVEAIPGSDHRAVFAELVVPER